MKALELAKWLDDFHGADAQFPSKAAQDAAAELRRLAEVNAELLVALEKTVMPLELYKAYGWPDRAGVIFNAKQAIAKAKEQQ